MIALAVFRVPCIIVMIRLYVTLLKTADSSLEYRKLILMVDSDLKVSMLKRHIEQEFTELFPNERPFICGKVEDQYGYSLSNVSYIRDLLKNDDRVVAVPEPASGAFVNSHDTKELVQLLATMQQSISVKLAGAAVESHEPLEELIMTVLPLCFVVNRETVYSTLGVLTRALTSATWRIVEDRSNAALLNLLVLGLQYWVFEVMDGDARVQNGLIDLLGVLMRSPSFCQSFKTPAVMNRLMNLTKVLTSEGRAKLVKVINGLSKADGSIIVSEESRPPREPARGAEQTSTYARTREEIPAYSRQRDEVSRQREEPPAYSRQREGAAYSRPREDAKGPEVTHQRDVYRPAEVARHNDPTRRPGSYPRLANLQSDNVILEYLNMFSSDSNPDMITFGLQSLDTMVEDATDLAIVDRNLFLTTFNLIEYAVPADVQHVQVRFLRQLSDKITPQRCMDALEKGGCTRILKAYPRQPAEVQEVLEVLLRRLLEDGLDAVEVPALISLALCPYPVLSEMGMKTIAVISDPNRTIAADGQFENHVAFFVNSLKSAKASRTYKNYVTAALANLALRDSLRPQIIFTGGIENLVGIIKDPENVEGQRLAAKALVNLTATNRETRMRIIAELSEEVRMMYRGELDSLVGTSARQCAESLSEIGDLEHGTRHAGSARRGLAESLETYLQVLVQGR